MNDACRILFVLGPSGAGKSRFAEYLDKRHRWLRLEIDQYPHGDGIDIYNLRRPWDLFFGSKEPAELAMELRRRAKQANCAGCVLSFPSGVVLPPEHISAAEKASIKVVYLYGSAAHCIHAFLERERNLGRNLGVDHWLANNCAPYITMSRPEFEPYRIDVFNIHGRRRSHVDVLRDIQSRRRLTRRPRRRSKAGRA
jgi:hypothetical protein